MNMDKKAGIEKGKGIELVLVRVAPFSAYIL